MSLIYLIAVYTTAKYAGLINSTNPDMAFTYIVAKLFSKPVLVIFYNLIALTIIATFWNTMASIYFVHFQKIKLIKIITVVVIAILSYMVANTFIDRVLDKMLLFNTPIALAFSLLYGVYG